MEPTRSHHHVLYFALLFTLETSSNSAQPKFGVAIDYPIVSHARLIPLKWFYRSHVEITALHDNARMCCNRINQRCVTRSCCLCKCRVLPPGLKMNYTMPGNRTCHLKGKHYTTKDVCFHMEHLFGQTVAPHLHPAKCSSTPCNPGGCASGRLSQKKTPLSQACVQKGSCLGSFQIFPEHDIVAQTSCSLVRDRRTDGQLSWLQVVGSHSLTERLRRAGIGSWSIGERLGTCKTRDVKTTSFAAAGVLQ